MENASKALLIAAAVLIVILLISLSIIIINSQKESVDSSQKLMSDLGVYKFNYKFMEYAGENKSKPKILNLLEMVALSNANFDNKVAVKLSRSWICL